MKILLISWGLTDKRFGGLPAYCEDLLREFVRRGHNCTYLDTFGRSWCPFPSRLRRRRCSVEGVTSWEWVGLRAFSEFHDGSRDPLAHIEASAREKRAFTSLLDSINPDVVHLGELIAFPVELLDLARERGIKLVFLAQDFYALCPNVKLMDVDGRVCTRSTGELICEKCSKRARPTWLSWLHWLNPEVFGRVKRLKNLFYRGLVALEGVSQKMAQPVLQPFQHRRERFCEQLTKLDHFLCMSESQANHIRAVLGELPNLSVMYCSRQTYASKPLEGLRQARPGQPLRFLALNIVSSAKGLDILLEVFPSLVDRFSDVELRLFGMNDSDHGQVPGISFCGAFRPEQLDAIAREADALILPSVWPEAYGYVGPELLSRGVPVIASTVGAMKEYVEDGINGFLFNPDSFSLLTLLERLCRDRKALGAVQTTTRAHKHRFPFFSEHCDSIEAIYRS